MLSVVSVVKNQAAPTHVRSWAALRGLWQRQVWWVGTWLLVGVVARVWSFGWFPLREDEALYAYWARLIASGQDTMLEKVAVDKPPFFIYALARFFTWFGPSVETARLLNELCSVLALALLWLLARRLYGSNTAKIALALFALSPFAIAFAPTVYTDPMMVAWLLLALLCASYGLGLGAGLALGMAFASKQNALLFAPLILGVLLLAPPLSLSPHLRLPRFLTSSPPRLLVSLLTAAAGFYFIWYKVWQWDGWRILPAEIPSFWEQAWRTYGGLAWVSPDRWGERLAAWADVWRWLGGWTVGALALAFLILGGLLTHTTHYALRSTQHASRITYPASSPPRLTPHASRLTLLLLLFTLAYLLVHVVFSFQPWDRYLLGVTPLLALLAAVGATALWQRWQGRPIMRGLVAVVLTLSLVWGAGQAAVGRIPVGGDHGAYLGIEAVASYLQKVVPAERGVLYHRWLGWHWQWYLWDGPHGRVYWADPQMLVDDLRPDPFGYTRFVVFPAWHDDERPALEKALAEVELRLTPRLLVRVGRRPPPAVHRLSNHAGGTTVSAGLRRSEHWRDVLALLALALAVLVAYRLALFTNLAPGAGDFLYYYLPYWDYVNEALRAGRLPLWNPYLFAGAPLQANPQAMLFYPLRWLFVPFSAEKGILFSAALHAWLAGAFTYLLARRAAKVGPLPALVAGLIFALNGWATGLLGHPNRWATLPWLPAALWLWEMLPSAEDQRTLRNPRLRRLLLALAAVWALALLAGHSQTFYNQALIFICWALTPALWRAWLGCAQTLTSGIAPGLAIGLAASADVGGDIHPGHRPGRGATPAHPRALDPLLPQRRPGVPRARRAQPAAVVAGPHLAAALRPRPGPGLRQRRLRRMGGLHRPRRPGSGRPRPGLRTSPRPWSGPGSGDLWYRPRPGPV